MARQEQQQCIICKKPSLLGFTHPRCGSSQIPNVVISLFNYRDPRVARSIIMGKYYFIKSVYLQLGQSLASYIQKELPAQLLADFILVPIPLAAQRKRWRGYNQSEIIAKELSNVLGVALEDILVRGKNTLTQKDLDKETRKTNVQNAFGLKNNVNVKGKNYILVDDVVTTGATLIEASKVLKRNGANKVWCMTLARD